MLGHFGSSWNPRVSPLTCTISKPAHPHHGRGPSGPPARQDSGGIPRRGGEARPASTDPLHHPQMAVGHASGDGVRRDVLDQRLGIQVGHHRPSPRAWLLGLGVGPRQPRVDCLVKVRIAQAVDDARLLLSTGSQTVPGRTTSQKAAEGKLSALSHQLVDGDIRPGGQGS